MFLMKRRKRDLKRKRKRKALGSWKTTSNRLIHVRLEFLNEQGEWAGVSSKYRKLKWKNNDGEIYKFCKIHKSQRLNKPKAQ